MEKPRLMARIFPRSTHVSLSDISEASTPDVHQLSSTSSTGEAAVERSPLFSATGEPLWPAEGTYPIPSSSKSGSESSDVSPDHHREPTPPVTSPASVNQRPRELPHHSATEHENTDATSPAPSLTPVAPPSDPLARAVRTASRAAVFSHRCAKRFPTSISNASFEEFADADSNKHAALCVCHSVLKPTTSPLKVDTSVKLREEPLESDFPCKTTPITDEYTITHEIIGIGESGKVMACFSKRNGKEKFALKVLKESARSRREVQLHYLTK